MTTCPLHQGPSSFCGHSEGVKMVGCGGTVIDVAMFHVLEAILGGLSGGRARSVQSADVPRKTGGKNVTIIVNYLL